MWYYITRRFKYTEHFAHTNNLPRIHSVRTNGTIKTSSNSHWWRWATHSEWLGYPVLGRIRGVKTTGLLFVHTCFVRIRHLAGTSNYLTPVMILQTAKSMFTYKVIIKRTLAYWMHVLTLSNLICTQQCSPKPQLILWFLQVLYNPKLGFLYSPGKAKHPCLSTHVDLPVSWRNMRLNPSILPLLVWTPMK